MDRLTMIEKLSYYECKINEVTNESVKEYYKRKFNELLHNIEVYRVTYDYDSPQDVINKMIKELNCPKDYASNKTRKREYVQDRHITMFLCKHIFKRKTLGYIGKYFCSGDHATVLHAIKSVNNLRETDKKYKKYFDLAQKHILGNIEY